MSRNTALYIAPLDLFTKRWYNVSIERRQTIKKRPWEEKMAGTVGFDVKRYKRKLITEQIDTDPVAKRGMAVSRSTLLGLVFLRLALFVFEIIYYSVAQLSLNVVSTLLLLPMLLIVYMVYDGNKGISSVLLVSAIVRAIWLFSSVYPTLPAGSAANAYLGVYLAVMAYQFAVILLMTVYAPCVAYFGKMQKINMEVASALRGGAAKQSSAYSAKPGTNSKKKKRK